LFKNDSYDFMMAKKLVGEGTGPAQPGYSPGLQPGLFTFKPVGLVNSGLIVQPGTKMNFEYRPEGG
jgi:hypothetical protein